MFRANLIPGQRSSIERGQVQAPPSPMKSIAYVMLYLQHLPDALILSDL